MWLHCSHNSGQLYSGTGSSKLDWTNPELAWIFISVLWGFLFTPLSFSFDFVKCQTPQNTCSENSAFEQLGPGFPPQKKYILNCWTQHKDRDKAHTFNMIATPQRIQGCLFQSQLPVKITTYFKISSDYSAALKLPTSKLGDNPAVSVVCFHVTHWLTVVLHLH